MEGGASVNMASKKVDVDLSTVPDTDSSDDDDEDKK
jgi:hypothetical protein